MNDFILRNKDDFKIDVGNASLEMYFYGPSHDNCRVVFLTQGFLLVVYHWLLLGVKMTFLYYKVDDLEGILIQIRLTDHLHIGETFD